VRNVWPPREREAYEAKYDLWEREKFPGSIGSAEYGLYTSYWKKKNAHASLKH
jgi:hypothetical protein